MGKPRNDPYFDWLSHRVVTRPRTSQSYWSLLEFMYHYEFVWQILGDDNRAEDGRALRHEFLDDIGEDGDSIFLSAPCSILEMLIAFAEKASYQTDISRPEWFWKFVNALGLGDCTDDSFDPEQAEDALYNFVWRTYQHDGTGGLFPMREPKHDQREVEIWYQFSEYLAEHDEIGY